MINARIHKKLDSSATGFAFQGFLCPVSEIACILLRSKWALWSFWIGIKNQVRVFLSLVKRFCSGNASCCSRSSWSRWAGIAGDQPLYPITGTQVLLRDLVSENLGYRSRYSGSRSTPWSGFHLKMWLSRILPMNYPDRPGTRFVDSMQLSAPFTTQADRSTYYSGRRRGPHSNREQARRAPDDAAALAERNPSPEVATIPSAPGESAPNEPQTPGKTSKVHTIAQNFWIEIQKFKIQQGSVYLMGENGVPSVSLRKVEGSVDYRKGNTRER